MSRQSHVTLSAYNPSSARSRTRSCSRPVAQPRDSDARDATRAPVRRPAHGAGRPHPCGPDDLHGTAATGIRSSASLATSREPRLYAAGLIRPRACARCAMPLGHLPPDIRQISALPDCPERSASERRITRVRRYAITFIRAFMGTLSNSRRHRRSRNAPIVSSSPHQDVASATPPCISAFDVGL